jgi:acyl carrier protein
VTDADYKHKLRSFIEERFLVTFDDDFPEGTDLFREGVMDSFGYVQLHRYMESEFGVTFTEADLTQGVLVSLTQIQAHVAQRLNLPVSAKT